MSYRTEVPVGEVVRTSPSWVLPPTHPQPAGPPQEGHRLGHTAPPCLVARLVWVSEVSHTGILLTPEDDLDKDPPTSSLSASPRGRYGTRISHPLQLYQVLSATPPSPHPRDHYKNNSQHRAQILMSG